MKTPFYVLLILSLMTVAAIAKEPALDLKKYRAFATKKWEKTIAEMEALDETEQHPANSILFIGSSSIRTWEDIASDIAPYHPIQRGFGGSRWSDVAVYADRLITPHQFRAVVFFVGNDIRGADDDRTPEEVAEIFSYVVDRVRAHDPDAPVFYVAVTPTPKRWEAWPQTKKANTAARAVCAQRENVFFIGTESIFIDAGGQPRPELFLEDQLHQNRDGYIRWAAAIKTHLDTVLGGVK